MKTNLPIAAALMGLLLFFSHLAVAGESWQKTDHKPAASVLGQVDFVSGQNNQGGPPAANTMNDPADVAVDPTTGKVFVSDSSNRRVLRFSSMAALVNNAGAEAVLGQPDFATITPLTSRSGMNGAGGLAIDGSGRLWVLDGGNNRVLRFDNASAKANGADADGVLGQPFFTSGGAGLNQSAMSGPSGLAVDSAGRLWVADTANSRVLRFDNAAGKANGAGADGVLGQPNFGVGTAATSQAGMNFPEDVAIDSSGRLWVVESNNNRVLRFDGAAAKANGAAADGVLGQANFNTSGTGTTATQLNLPNAVAAGPNGEIWVCDVLNHRVLRFDNAAAKGNGAAANGVLGQPDFVSGDNNTTREGLNFPTGVGVEGQGRLWIADLANDRVVRFQANLFQPDGLVGARRSRQVGDNTYDARGVGQMAKVVVKGNRTGKAFLTVENDGDVADDFTVTGTKGNRKLKVKYLGPGGNVTGAMTRGGLTLAAQGVGARTALTAKIKGTRKSRGKQAGRTLTVSTKSATDGETDTVKAKVKKSP